MKLTILGCGTSGGVPKVPEFWGACDPNNPKNRRRRASVLVEEGDTTLIVDTTPDFREQMISAQVKKLDAVLYTHDHADHTHGIDDIRGYYQDSRQKIPVFGAKETLDTLWSRFNYIFKEVEGYPTIAVPYEIEGAFTFKGIPIQPFTQIHGNTTSLGFRFGDIAYSTDLNGLPEAAFEALDGVKIWVVDALRYQPHPTHSHLEQTLKWIERVAPEKAILTHMTWDMDYQALVDRLPDGVEPAYDGMVIEA